jgi:hypothetical protein
MAFVPQNFVDKVGPIVAAAWLNPLDVTVNSVLAGAQTVAQALTALGVVAKQKASKAAQTSRTTTVLAADPDLSLTVPGAGIFRFEISLGVSVAGSSGATPGISLEPHFSGTLATGTSQNLGNYFGAMDGAVSGAMSVNAATGFSLTSLGTNGLTIIGYFQCTNGGTFALEWAQNNTSGNPVLLVPGSYMTLEQLG